MKKFRLCYLVEDLDYLGSKWITRCKRMDRSDNTNIQRRGNIRVLVLKKSSLCASPNQEDECHT